MRSCTVVVVEVARQDAFEMALTQNNHVIQTFPAYGADDPFGIVDSAKVIVVRS